MRTETNTLEWQPSLPEGFWTGLVLVGLIAVLSLWASERPLMQAGGLSALTLAILLGMVLGNTVFPRLMPTCSGGVEFSRTRLLRLGVVLYGFRITFQQIAAVGWAGLLIDLVVVACTFLLAVGLGRRLFRLDRDSCILIGAGSAICGAAAVVATDSVVRGQPHKSSVAVATVVVFGTLAMFLYPWLYTQMPLSDTEFGVYAGSTIHEVAQVVVAGNAVSAEVAATAVVTKMLRVMLLAPFLLLLGGILSRRDGRSARGPLAVPWFALLFIAATGIHSTGLLPAALVSAIVQADNLLLAMAMAALGLTTRIGAIRQAGLRPMLLAGALFAFLMTGGYAINRAVLLLT